MADPQYFCTDLSVQDVLNTWQEREKRISDRWLAKAIWISGFIAARSGSILSNSTGRHLLGPGGRPSDKVALAEA